MRFEEKRGLEPGPRRWEFHLPREILEPSRGWAAHPLVIGSLLGKKPQWYAWDFAIMSLNPPLYSWAVSQTAVKLHHWIVAEGVSLIHGDKSWFHHRSVALPELNGDSNGEIINTWWPNKHHKPPSNWLFFNTGGCIPEIQSGDHSPYMKLTYIP